MPAEETCHGHKHQDLNLQESPPDNTGEEITSPWRLLKQQPFGALWVANLISYVGGWTQDTGASWAMASLNSDPLLVSLVQMASNAPIFVLALPAGALADSFDRRGLLLFAQYWMMATAALMALVAYKGALNSVALVLFTLSLAAGNAFAIPAWQASLPELVRQRDLMAAITINGNSINLSRAVGPMLGGLILTWAGAWACFAANALTFALVIVALVRWKSPPASNRRRESLTGATLAGLRYLRHSPRLRRVYWRALSFLLPASGLWGLLPVLVKVDHHLDAIHYGAVLTSLGVGSGLIVSRLVWLRDKLGINRVIAVFGSLYAVGLAALPWCGHFGALVAVALSMGACWLACLTSFQVAIQTHVPAWIRARALSVYYIVYFGALSLGSVMWGALARHTDTRTALWVAGILTLVSSLLSAVWLPTPHGPTPNLAPAGAWPLPEPPADEASPVLIVHEYPVPRSQHSEALPILEKIGRARRRDGGYDWTVSSDPEQPDMLYEIYYSPNWADHLALHERATYEDQELHDRLATLFQGPHRVRHMSVHLL